jgi:chemotaxis protein CheZ
MTTPTTPESVLDAERYDDLLSRVGHLTRSLHESLRELGLDKEIERLAKDDIANTRDRLMYVAKMTEQAAQRVLNATDAAGPLQEQIEQGADALLADWQAAQAGNVPAELAQRTLAFLEATRGAAAATRGHLIDIMMAQDFQDLTGQVITKVTKLGHSLESQLVQLLIDHAPNDGKRDTGNGLLNGPQVNPEGKADVVAGQEQVDDLLESLGF